MKRGMSTWSAIFMGAVAQAVRRRRASAASGTTPLQRHVSIPMTNHRWIRAPRLLVLACAKPCGLQRRGEHDPLALRDHDAPRPLHGHREELRLEHLDG